MQTVMIEVEFAIIFTIMAGFVGSAITYAIMKNSNKKNNSQDASAKGDGNDIKQISIEHISIQIIDHSIKKSDPLYVKFKQSELDDLVITNLEKKGR